MQTYQIGYYDDMDERSSITANDRMKFFLAMAAKEGTKSGMSHRHGCVVVHRGRIIAKGHNKIRRDAKEDFSVHAEVDAIRNASKNFKRLLPDSELYVVRVSCERFDNSLKYSKPCPSCSKFISKIGIKKTFYSTNEEFERVIAHHFGIECRLHS